MTSSKEGSLLLSATHLPFSFLRKGHRQNTSTYGAREQRGDIRDAVTRRRRSFATIIIDSTIHMWSKQKAFCVAQVFVFCLVCCLVCVFVLYVLVWSFVRYVFVCTCVGCAACVVCTCVISGCGGEVSCDQPAQKPLLSLAMPLAAAPESQVSAWMALPLRTFPPQYPHPQPFTFLPCLFSSQHTYHSP